MIFDNYTEKLLKIDIILAKKKRHTRRQHRMIFNYMKQSQKYIYQLWCGGRSVVSIVIVTIIAILFDGQVRQTSQPHKSSPQMSFLHTLRFQPSRHLGILVICLVLLFISCHQNQNHQLLKKNRLLTQCMSTPLCNPIYLAWLPLHGRAPLFWLAPPHFYFFSFFGLISPFLWSIRGKWPTKLYGAPIYWILQKVNLLPTMVPKST